MMPFKLPQDPRHQRFAKIFLHTKVDLAGEPLTPLMPGILGQFKRHHPQVRIVARVDRNGPLRQALAEEALDLALLWQTEDQGPGLGLCPLAWIAHPDLDIRALLVWISPVSRSPCSARRVSSLSASRRLA